MHDSSIHNTWYYVVREFFLQFYRSCNRGIDYCALRASESFWLDTCHSIFTKKNSRDKKYGRKQRISPVHDGKNTDESLLEGSPSMFYGKMITRSTRHLAATSKRCNDLSRTLFAGTLLKRVLKNHIRSSKPARLDVAIYTIDLQTFD